MQGFELLNCDDHVGAHRKANRDPADSRPDITHQLMMALLDSPLNKAGRLQIYIQTKQNVLIEVHPSTRIPRTFKRFAGLMGECMHQHRKTRPPYDRSITYSTVCNISGVAPGTTTFTVLRPHGPLALPAVQLLHKLRVRAADGSETLLKVIKNPVTAHLPLGCHIVGLEAGGELVDAIDLPARLPKDRDLCFVVGAMSRGDIHPDYTQSTLSLSRFPLSAACSVSKLMNAFEHAWGVL